MTEDRKHQLDELSVTDILSYLGARASNTEEYIRRTDRRLAKAKEIITALLNVFVYDKPDDEIDSGQNDVKIKAEQFIKEA